jgi:glycosyltransferase involved in cell wall biosynthesis
VSNGPKRLQLDRARLYDQVRTAHLERAHRLTPAAIVYGSRRYDFDDRLAEGLGVIQAGNIAAAALLARSGVTVLEVNEPLNIAALPRTVLVLAALRLRGMFTRRHPLVVTYAIENMDPFGLGEFTKRRTRIRRRIERRLARFVWRRIDRIAYGTAAARALYRAIFPVARRAETLISALPESCTCESWTAREPHRVVFLGALNERKGFPLLLDAWPLIRERDPRAQLTILGKGPLEERAAAAARTDPSIELVIDAPRDEIHRQLGRSQVLTLPSQPRPDWREQVGLPIIEGLAHGCSIVTTTETGIAGWLTEHGHGVIDPRCMPAEFAASILHQLEGGASAQLILASLPREDGRLAADRWMFAPADAASPPAPQATQASSP